MVDILFSSQWRHTSLTHKHTLMIKWHILAKQRCISPNWCPPVPTFNQSNPPCSLPITNWHSPQFDTCPIHTHHLIWNSEGKIVWKPLIIEGINQEGGLYDRSEFLPALDTYWIFPFPYPTPPPLSSMKCPHSVQCTPYSPSYYYNNCLI